MAQNTLKWLDIENALTEIVGESPENVTFVCDVLLPEVRAKVERLMQPRTRLARIRESLDLKSRVVAKKIGLSKSSFSRLETGSRSTKLPYVRDLSFLYNVTFEFLLRACIEDSGMIIEEPLGDELRTIAVSKLRDESPLREIRNAYGMKLDDTAPMIGFSKSTLSRMENRQTDPTIEDVVTLAPRFGLTVEEFARIFVSPNETSIGGE